MSTDPQTENHISHFQRVVKNKNWPKKNVAISSEIQILKFYGKKNPTSLPVGGDGEREVTEHDDVIKWKYFPPFWLFVRGIHRSPVNSPHKRQWRGAFVLSLICVWMINGWVNNREDGDLRRHRAHYGVIVMITSIQTDTWTHRQTDRRRDRDGYDNVVSKPRVVMLTLLSLAAREAVVMTAGASNDDKVDIMTTLGFLWPIMMPNLWSLAVVTITPFDIIDNKVGMVTTLGFQWLVMMQYDVIITSRRCCDVGLT